jgi:hypothetical protein
MLYVLCYVWLVLYSTVLGQMLDLWNVYACNVMYNLEDSLDNSVSIVTRLQTG